MLEGTFRAEPNTGFHRCYPVLPCASHYTCVFAPPARFPVPSMSATRASALSPSQNGALAPPPPPPPAQTQRPTVRATLRSDMGRTPTSPNADTRGDGSSSRSVSRGRRNGDGRSVDSLSRRGSDAAEVPCYPPACAIVCRCCQRSPACGHVRQAVMEVEPVHAPESPDGGLRSALASRVTELEAALRAKDSALEALQEENTAFQEENEKLTAELDRLADVWLTHSHLALLRCTVTALTLCCRFCDGCRRPPNPTVARKHCRKSCKT